MESYQLYKFLKLFSETFEIRDIPSDENCSNEIVKKENITDNRRKRSPYNENEHSNYEGGSRETSPKLINGQHQDGKDTNNENNM